MKILVINGPNLNMLGRRELNIYGSETFEKIWEWLKGHFPEEELEYFQSNSEGELISRLHKMEDENFNGLVINPGAFTHYSYALRDALRIVQVPKVEVHMSNIFARDEFRQKSVTGAAVHGVIGGLGKDGYKLAIDWILSHKKRKVGFGAS